MSLSQIDAEFKSSDLYFSGKVLWKESDMKLCDINNDYVPDRHLTGRSYRYHTNYEWVNAEVLSVNPPIVKYPNFLKPRLIRVFLAYAKTLKIGRLAAKGSKNTDEFKLKESRVVDGAFVRHNQTDETVELYDFVQARIKAFDLSKSDKFLITKFESESHHVPHYDYLRQHHDIETRGNRMATITLYLKVSQFGGSELYVFYILNIRVSRTQQKNYDRKKPSFFPVIFAALCILNTHLDTIFSNKQIAFRPNIGDAIISLNMNPSYERENGSLIGQCPVVWGRKWSVSIFVRSKGQELHYLCPLNIGHSFLLSPLVRPR
jgi:hypothetical protein